MTQNLIIFVNTIKAGEIIYYLTRSSNMVTDIKKTVTRSLYVDFAAQSCYSISMDLDFPFSVRPSAVVSIKQLAYFGSRAYTPYM